MTSAGSVPITELLQQWASGDRGALDHLMPIVYTDLRKIARNRLRNEREGLTIQTSDLIHEAYLRMAKQTNLSWESRVHFFAFAAELMRRILIDHARARLTSKRGAAGPTVCIGDGVDVEDRSVLNLEEMIDLDGALRALSEYDPEMSQLVVMKYFGGLDVDQLVLVTGKSRATVKRRWQHARYWLARYLGTSPSHGS